MLLCLFCFQFRECFWVRCVFVHSDDPWFADMGSGKGFKQEVLCCFCVSRRAEEEIERLTM
ncbi:hypothetical protein KSF_002510 [Reticulibacter mediterranei]|uniref:Uncharacterized protein n=1 Tax=Reticulibacter mediterranei TaxID=2778369 RepID=A0A8J3MZ92_9CHLR|nr:hypothetical protein KSF_002510 [Reticulibacter mediterranei]